MSRNKIKIALDMDEVIVDLIGNWKSMYRVKAGIPHYIPIPVNQWDVAIAFSQLPKEEVYSMLDIPGMFASCNPIPGALESISLLLRNPRLDIHILTVAKAKSAYSEKINWITRNLGPYFGDKVIGLPCHTLKAELTKNYDIIVEDNSLTLQKSAGNDCHRILFDQPHNQNAEFPRDFDQRVYGWKELYEVISNYEKDI